MNTRTPTVPLSELIRALAPKEAISILFTLLIAASARFSFVTPFSPVPVSLQVAAVLLAGLALGPKWGAWSVIQYIALGILGAPVFALGFGGPAIVTQPSFGYLIGFAFAAYATGLIASTSSRSFPRGLLASAVGLVLIYAFGMTWLAGYLKVGGAAMPDAFIAAFFQGVVPFVAIDCMKTLLVAGIWSLPGTARPGR